jgi:hypothetical protein
MAGTKRKASACNDVDANFVMTKHPKIAPSCPARRSARLVSRFLALPQELKDMIYHQLWLLTPNIIIRADAGPPSMPVPYSPLPPPAYHPLIVQVRYGGAPEDAGPYALPIWLLTNKEVLASGLEKLHENVRLSWDDVSFDHGLATKSTRLIDLSCVSHAALRCTLGANTNRTVMRLEPPATRNMQVLVNHLAPSLRSVQFTMVMQYPSYVDGNWTIEFPAFEEEGSVIEWLGVRLKVFGVKEEQEDVVKEAVNQMFAKLGRMIKGEKNRFGERRRNGLEEYKPKAFGFRVVKA